MAYSGTFVTAGTGRGLVVATGVETEIGRVYQLVGEAEGVTTPLTRRLSAFSRWLTIVIMVLAGLTLAVGVLRGEGIAEMVTAAVALAVGAIPEGLPAAVRTRIDELPFSSELRLMATLHEAPAGGTGLIVVKGAAEAVLDLCGSQRTLEGGVEPLDRARIESQVAAFGEEALRVLAFATVRAPRGWTFGTGDLADLSMTFIGLQAMADPPRPEAIRAVEACHTAGIAVKMITGDHARTARAVAARMGLQSDRENDPVVMTGVELAELAPPDVAHRIAAVDVFARVSAEQKLMIIRGLQRSGQIVAMTGDGINDAPALKQADIGIAMGHSGTEVAKEASDMVLTDDSFASIEAAVEEGRSIFDNLTKFITWTLPTNLGEGLVVLAAITTGAALPILPVRSGALLHCDPKETHRTRGKLVVIGRLVFPELCGNTSSTARSFVVTSGSFTCMHTEIVKPSLRPHASEGIQSAWKCLRAGRHA